MPLKCTSVPASHGAKHSGSVSVPTSTVVFDWRNKNLIVIQVKLPDADREWESLTPQGTVVRGWQFEDDWVDPFINKLFLAMVFFFLENDARKKNIQTKSKLDM